MRGKRGRRQAKRVESSYTTKLPGGENLSPAQLEFALQVIAKLGLHESPPLGDIWKRYWPIRKKEIYSPKNELTLWTNYLEPLGAHTAATLKPHHIREMRSDWMAKRAPETLNKVRN